MIKKIYPKIIVMRKSIIGTAIGSILLIVTLILFNMYHTIHQKKTAKLRAAISSKALVANNAETYWYQNATIQKLTNLSTKNSELDPELSIDQQNTNTDINYEKAKAMPINTNQININLENSITDLQSNIESTASDNQQKNHYLHETLQTPISPYEIKTGTIIPGILITGINSDLPGQIIGQVRSNIYDTVTGKYLLIPQGAKITGAYDSQIIYNQKRLLVVWKRIIFPNGKSLDLEEMPGIDLNGYSGFHDQVNHHYAKMLSSVILLSVLSAGAELNGPQMQHNYDQLSINQSLAQSLGSNIENLATSITMKNLDIQPTLKIRPGYLFNINVTKDIIMPGNYDIT